MVCCMGFGVWILSLGRRSHVSGFRAEGLRFWVWGFEVELWREEDAWIPWDRGRNLLNSNPIWKIDISNGVHVCGIAAHVYNCISSSQNPSSPTIRHHLHNASRVERKNLRIQGAEAGVQVESGTRIDPNVRSERRERARAAWRVQWSIVKAFHLSV